MISFHFFPFRPSKFISNACRPINQYCAAHRIVWIFRFELSVFLYDSSDSWIHTIKSDFISIENSYFVEADLARSVVNRSVIHIWMVNKNRFLMNITWNVAANSSRCIPQIDSIGSICSGNSHAFPTLILWRVPDQTIRFSCPQNKLIYMQMRQIWILRNLFKSNETIYATSETK